MKTIAYIAAGILIFFGILFVWGAFSSQGSIGWIFIGLISIGIGFVIIWLTGRSKLIQDTNGSEVTYKIDLPANINLDTLKCQSCGGSLSADNIKIVNGAPMVSCPYCNTTYQLSEDPKW
jgi:hypothetical protein